jgi:hypothetical protein
VAAYLAEWAPKVPHLAVLVGAIPGWALGVRVYAYPVHIQEVFPADGFGVVVLGHVGFLLGVLRSGPVLIGKAGKGVPELVEQQFNGFAVGRKNSVLPARTPVLGAVYNNYPSS